MSARESSKFKVQGSKSVESSAISRQWSVVGGTADGSRTADPESSQLKLQSRVGDRQSTVDNHGPLTTDY